MVQLTDSVRGISGIGDQRAKALSKLGIETLYNLISYFPRSYDDRTVFCEINSLIPGESNCVRAVVAETPRLSRIRRGLELLRFRIYDESGSLNVTYFNQGYLKTAFTLGEEYVFYGKASGTLLKPELTNPVFEKASAAGAATGRIVPVYRLTAGVSQKLIAQAISFALKSCLDYVPEILPQSVRTQYSLSSAQYSYSNIHFPKDTAALALSRRRLIFEELFVLSCALGMFRGERVNRSGIIPEKAELSEFYSSLPFTLTNAQKRSIDEAVGDMLSGRAMSRLVQGDVGSGKTAVAAACIWYMARSGFQCAFMAPTEILARQHFETLTALLSPLGIKVGLLTGHLTAKQKRETLALLESGETDLVIGTHAIISDNVHFRSLALVVTDEQHRFGVSQRAALTEKGKSTHVLVMSATPIPRTLALMIYGDLDVSVIDELPPGRLPVETFSVGEDKRRRVEEFIRKQVSEGRQVFIVCPLIEESEGGVSELKAAQSYAQELQSKIFPNLRVALIHGKMKAKEKETVMAGFSGGSADILVSTTIVEVGIDVPNASLMVVENAERFGLSQLHQLRGRVGRGQHRSYCILMRGADCAGDSKERLAVMCKTQSGFQIAEEDLRIRGPGDFFGERQHGLPEMHIADLSCDMSLLREAQEAAAETLRADPSLSLSENSPLKEHIQSLFNANISSFN